MTDTISKVGRLFMRMCLRLFVIIVAILAPLLCLASTLWHMRKTGSLKGWARVTWAATTLTWSDLWVRFKAGEL